MSSASKIPSRFNRVLLYNTVVNTSTNILKYTWFLCWFSSLNFSLLSNGCGYNLHWILISYRTILEMEKLQLDLMFLNLSALKQHLQVNDTRHATIIVKIQGKAYFSEYYIICPTSFPFLSYFTKQKWQRANGPIYAQRPHVTSKVQDSLTAAGRLLPLFSYEGLAGSHTDENIAQDYVPLRTQTFPPSKYSHLTMFLTHWPSVTHCPPRYLYLFVWDHAIPTLENNESRRTPRVWQSRKKSRVDSVHIVHNVLRTLEQLWD